jgi:hypothetical protein
MVRNRKVEQQGKCCFVKFGHMSENALTKKGRKRSIFEVEENKMAS